MMELLGISGIGRMPMEQSHRTCHEAAGLQVVTRFSDAAISGGKWHGDAPRQDFDIIVTEDISRLWRDRAERLILDCVETNLFEPTRGGKRRAAQYREATAPRDRRIHDLTAAGTVTKDGVSPGKNRRPKGRRLRVSGSSDDASMFASALSVGRDREGRCEVEIPLPRAFTRRVVNGRIRLRMCASRYQ
jgi:hypothetical protein